MKLTADTIAFNYLHLKMKGGNCISLDKIDIVSDTLTYSIEKNIDELGFVFICKLNNRKRVVALLLDTGEDDFFNFIRLSDKGVEIMDFRPQNILKHKDGKPAPIECDSQMELTTKFGTKLIVRHLFLDKRQKGIVIARKKEDHLITLLICGEQDDHLCFLMSK